jgi:hypothetical protein
VNLPPGPRKLALMAHLTSSLGWVGAVLAYLALVVTALRSVDPGLVRTALLALEIVALYAIIPLAAVALLSGLIQSLGTEWGLFRHYWVVFKLLLTSIATAILLLHVPTISYMASAARAQGSYAPTALQGELLHAGAGLVVLLVITSLGVFKPKGMTPYGWRKLHERRNSP